MVLEGSNAIKIRYLSGRKVYSPFRTLLADVMTSLGRTFACMIAAAGFGFIGLMVVAIFGPLAFPLSLSDSVHAENAVFVLMLIVTLLFAVSGVMLCWKITSRWVR